MNTRLWIALIVLAAATLPASAVSPYVDVLIADVPHVRQKPDFCGEACIEMWLRKCGLKVTQDEVFDIAPLDPALGRGCWTKELTAAIKTLGFKAGATWYRVKAGDSAALDKQFAAMHADLKRGVPSIVCMKYNVDPKSTEHFRLILGYDSKTDEVIYHEPAKDDAPYQRMSRATFLRTWPLVSGRSQWTVIRMALDGTPTKPALADAGFTNADFAQHVLELRKTLPTGFTVIVEKPFVVIGDESAAMVQRRAQSTVRWSVERLKKQYFAKDPADILDIWLFRDKASYEKHCKKLFGRTPHTPYGFYSDVRKALIMNIATGGGTLVHEIVHPFMDANFPQCPAWFNEGMGSLYEQSSARGGKIVGLTNWRLAGLQRALRGDGVPTFAKLCGTTTDQFYGEDQGTNYAQARYLCYYLQEKGLLEKYYHEFVKNAAADPSGYKILKSILGREDMAAFEAEWKKFVLGLRFP